tara:strand:- start:394 stop:1089 length:696 start_codon:yes stop_codon:yes gene_type:complete
MAAATAIAAGVGIASIATGIYQSNKAAGIAEENMEMQEGIAKEQLKFQKQQQVKLDAQKEIYKDMEFTNPYAENVYEDLTVNQQQAEFERKTFQQSQANIMQNLKGAAGGSGIASLAQSLANQGQLASQRAAASIGMQEKQNEILRAQGAQQTQAGEEKLQMQEMSRQSTLLGMEMGEMTGARAGVQQAQANQMAAGAAQVGAASTAASGMMSAGTGMLATAGQMYEPPPP